MIFSFSNNDSGFCQTAGAEGTSGGTGHEAIIIFCSSKKFWLLWSGQEQWVWQETGTMCIYLGGAPTGSPDKLDLGCEKSTNSRCLGLGTWKDKVAFTEMGKNC